MASSTTSFDLCSQNSPSGKQGMRSTGCASVDGFPNADEHDRVGPRLFRGFPSIAGFQEPRRALVVLNLLNEHTEPAKMRLSIDGTENVRDDAHALAVRDRAVDTDGGRFTPAFTWSERRAREALPRMVERSGRKLAGGTGLHRQWARAGRDGRRPGPRLILHATRAPRACPVRSGGIVKNSVVWRRTAPHLRVSRRAPG